MISGKQNEHGTDVQSLDNQMGLIAKLKEVKEQLDSCSSGEDGGEDCVEDDNESANQEPSEPPSRQEPNESDPKNHFAYHFNFADTPEDDDNQP